MNSDVLRTDNSNRQTHLIKPEVNVFYTVTAINMTLATVPSVNPNTLDVSVLKHVDVVVVVFFNLVLI